MIAIFIRPNINFVRKGRVVFARGGTHCPIVSQNIKDMAKFRDHRILHRCLKTLSVVEIFYLRILTRIENFSLLTYDRSLLIENYGTYIYEDLKYFKSTFILFCLSYFSQ